MPEFKAAPAPADGAARAWRATAIGLPMLWLAVFVALPVLVVAAISFSEAVIAIPPIAPLAVQGADGGWALDLKLLNYARLFEDPLYIRAFGNSLLYAAIATAVCLVLAYPVAYAAALAPPKWKPVLLFLMVLPFWSSFLIRIYALQTLLRDTGLINGALQGLGLIDAPIRMLNTDFGVVMGLIYTYLPFMTLPLYASLEKLDRSLLEAAADLGAGPARAFFTVTLPLSLPGAIAGALLVFIPVAGEFVIPDLLGGPGTEMIGKILWEEFSANRDWPMASALASVLILVLLAPMALFYWHSTRRLSR